MKNHLGIQRIKRLFPVIALLFSFIFYSCSKESPQDNFQTNPPQLSGNLYFHTAKPNQIVKYNFSGDVFETLVSENELPVDLSVSLTGRKLAFISGDSTIKVLDLTDAGVESFSPAKSKILEIAVNKEGTQIAFIAQTPLEP